LVLMEEKKDINKYKINSDMHLFFRNIHKSMWK
jgi:hypothetical protein